MKVYLITQEQMDGLRACLQLSALLQKEFLNTHDERKQIISDVHRSMNYQVCQWIDKVSK